MEKDTLARCESVLTEQQQKELVSITQRMLQAGKGILAADETHDLMEPRLKACGLTNTPENRRVYREMVFTSPHFSDYISGVILYDETFHQCTTRGDRIVDMLTKQGVVVGMQVDLGLVPLHGSFKKEWTTQGMDNLAQRAAAYKKGGCGFAKWRCAYDITNSTPSALALQENANLLARYASVCQSQGLVPIVEPDVSCQGDHSLERCQQVTEQVLAHTYKTLSDHHVFLEGTVLKTNMVVPGQSSKSNVTAQQIGNATLTALQRTVPASVPGIAFLSGGLSELQSTQYLNAINQAAAQQQKSGLSTKPWRVTFCYGRALQNTVVKIWQGKPENVGAAQNAFLHRAKANSQAEKGEYTGE